jgi:glycosyltransferase involved in cell wall biosynthesis
MKNHIIVNATALTDGGAHTILNQFLKEIPDDEYNYIVFIAKKINIKYTKNNITLIPKNFKSFIERFLWDCFGLKKWINKTNIIPVASISLQNINFRIGYKIPNFVYFHNSIPLFKKNWNIFNSSERTFWFYKNIYPFFIRIFLNNKTEIFVQLDIIKEEFSDSFNFPKDKIHVVRPKIISPKILDISKPKLDYNKLNLFYPATPLIHKNHNVLLQSILLLSDEIKGKVKLYLTCEEKDLKNILSEETNQFDIVFMGQISYSKVFNMYIESDALVFPSYIETFGLPLIESASLGSSIIAADLPYSREVLQSYKGVTYVKYNDPKLWSEQIELLIKNKDQIHESLKLKNKNSWPEFFNIIKNKIQNNA